MFPSLGYVDELTRAAERGEADTRSALAVERPALRRAAAAAFPEAASVSVDDEPLVGDGGLTYPVEVDSRDPAAVLKIVPEEASDALHRGTAAYEQLAAVEEVPVPEVYALDTSGSRLPSYSVVEYVNGDDLDAIAQFKALPRARKRTLVREIGRTLGALHERTAFDRYGALEPEGDGRLVVADGYADWVEFATARYERQADGPDDSPMRGLAREAVECFERLTTRLDAPAGPALLHGDFTPDNLVVGADGVRAVLDWEHAESGVSARELWRVEENVVNLFRTASIREELRDALYVGYHAVVPETDAFRALRAAFAVGEFAQVASVHGVLTDVVAEFDTVEFRQRAEAEFERRRERALALAVDSES